MTDEPSADGAGDTDPAPPPSRPRRADTGASPRRRRRVRPRHTAGHGEPSGGSAAPESIESGLEPVQGETDRDATYQEEPDPFDHPLDDVLALPRAEDPAGTTAPDGDRTDEPTPGSRFRRRRSRLHTALLVAGLAVIAITVVIVAFNLVDRSRELVDGDLEPETPVAVPDDAQPFVTVVTTRDGPDGPEVATIAGLTVDRSTGEGTVLLVPPATVTDVPGHGAFRLGEAFDFGGSELVRVSLDNLLGARSDAVVTVTEDGWAALLDRLGSVEITLSEPVIDRAEDGSGTTLLPAGPQAVDGTQLATLLTFRSGDESQLEQLPRVQAALQGVLDRIHDDPALLDPMFSGGAPELQGADPELVRTVLSELAAARGQDEVTTLTLFVSPLGSGDEDAYRPDTERIAELVDDRLAASKPEPGVAGGRSLQLLNGNGQPGIGAEVAALLQPAGYRVLLTGNADRFSYEVTRILVYDEEPATLAAARDVRDRLGVGQVERSGTPQSVVDLTIVIGRDFPPRDTPAD